MNSIFKSIIVLGFVLPFIFVGCFYALPLTARFYNLQNGTIITASLEDFSRGHGEIIASLSSGEFLTGEYTFNTFSSGIISSPKPYLRDEKENKESSEEKYPSSWAEDYGFTRNANVAPLGTATLVGNKGTVVEIIFFNLNYQYSYGDGVGRDNKGNKYRVHIGELNNSQTK